MKVLKVIGVKEIAYESSITEISGLLDRLDKNEINNLPWPSYPCKPSASFTIAYGPDCIFLKYFITEKQIRAVNDEPNSPVWQDTCVEFFVSFNDGKQYYNFEINCIGTILAAYGPDLEHRDFLPEKTIATVKTYTIIDKLSEPPVIHWDLIAVIPFTAFVHDNINSLQGVSARANFYKCGDKLKDPHYLAWNDIKAAKPDFHLPAFFGTLHF
ncbi:carbohydrate-binding family 9-like protein [Flavitalea sp.]|nr:carbohydrate-binding family 9-like protein [Flavitalea sp.]